MVEINLRITIDRGELHLEFFPKIMEVYGFQEAYIFPNVILPCLLQFWT
jgi:hypothetical protein